MQKILYFNDGGYCTTKRDQNTIFTMFCELPEDFIPEGIPIEDFVCNPKFKITNGRHINKGNADYGLGV